MLRAPLDTARSIPFGTISSGSVYVASGPLVLRGFGIKNTSANANAELDIYDGEGSGGQLVAQVTLAGNESVREWWSGGGIDIEHGVGLVWVSGSISGAVWIVYPPGEVTSGPAALE
jgi:hypothetical protein